MLKKLKTLLKITVKRAISGLVTFKLKGSDRKVTGSLELVGWLLHKDIYEVNL